MVVVQSVRACGRDADGAAGPGWEKSQDEVGEELHRRRGPVELGLAWVLAGYCSYQLMTLAAGTHTIGGPSVGGRPGGTARFGVGFGRLQPVQSAREDHL